MEQAISYFNDAGYIYLCVKSGQAVDCVVHAPPIVKMDGILVKSVWQTNEKQKENRNRVFKNKSLSYCHFVHKNDRSE